MLKSLSDCWSIEDEKTRSDEAGEEIIEHIEDVRSGAGVEVDRVTVRYAVDDDVDNIDSHEPDCIYHADLGGNNVATLLHVVILNCKVLFSLGFEESIEVKVSVNRDK